MKVVISKDEWYPFYSIEADPTDWERSYKGDVDVPDETLARWDAVMASFNAVQQEMGDACAKARETAPKDDGDTRDTR